MHRAECNARAPFEAIKGIKTVQAIAADNQVHPIQGTSRKIQMIAGASEVIEQWRGGKIQGEALESDKKRLERKIGQLVRAGRLALKNVSGAGDRSTLALAVRWWRMRSARAVI